MRFMRLAALPLLTLASSQAVSQANLPIRDTTLANGLHVIVIESHAVPLVTVELDVKNGSYTESPEYNGLSHLYEHMFFKANRTIPSQERYLQRLRELGLRRVQVLTWRETARRTLAVFNEIVPLEVSPRAATAPL